MIENCPDDIFLEAFSDRLYFSRYHTHEETQLEKAFLLKDGLKAVFLPQNNILSIVMLARLFQDKKYVDLARDKFNFTVRDFYKLQSNETLYSQQRADTKQYEFNLQIIEQNKNIIALQ